MCRLFVKILCVLLFLPGFAMAEQKLVLITIDGYRWQELFGGADATLINNPAFGNVKLMKDSYWADSRDVRRQRLMPFTWSYIAKKGVMIGDRTEGCCMDVTNKMWFSYPGYNEDLCGYADDQDIHSNGPLLNPNVTVLEVANHSQKYKNSVLAFGSWARFIEIFNEKRSGIKVNAGYRHAMTENPSEREQFLDTLTGYVPKLWEIERFDFLTHEYALEAMKAHHPKVLFIGYGDTDAWAHAGKYRMYLGAVHSVDSFIKELWNYAQSDPFYKDQTTFIVTCDHGRGDIGINAWRSHGAQTPHSSQTWLMAFGKGIPARGVLTSGKYFNNQIALTIAKILGIEYRPNQKKMGRPMAVLLNE